LINDFIAGVLNVIWAVLKELRSEIVHLLHKGNLTLLDVLSLCVLKWKNLFFDWTQSSFANIVEFCLALFKSDEDFVTWENNSVFFQENNGLLHWLKLSECSVLDDSDISQVSHNFHKALLLSHRCSLFWWSFDSVINFFNELLNVSHLLKGVLVKEVSVSINPLVDSHLKFSNQRINIDSQPADVHRGFHFSNFVLDLGQEDDFFIKVVEGWLSGLNSDKDFVSHPLEGLIFNFLSVVVQNDVLLLSWVLPSVEESLEVFLKSFLPEEFLVLVLSDEVLSSLLDFNHVVGDDLHASEKGKLILDFNQVVTIS